jgi:tRNA 5-methylaminomethyl-2-thiouridine biosynthesis bifunctional protein
LYNPRLSARRTPESDFHTAAWAQAARTFAAMQEQADIGFNPCGSLHLATDAEKEKKLRGALENWGWHNEHMQWLDAMEASRQAGATLHHPALWLPDAGTVSPVLLCGAWATGIDVRLNAAVTSCERNGLGWRIHGEEFDAVILACGTAITSFAGLEDFPVHAVRGQMTEIRATPVTSPLKANLCFGGYLSPQRGGVHRLGATFQQWLDDHEIRAEDDAANIARLAAVLPGPEKPEVTGSRVGFRASSRDRFPVIGPAPDEENLYLSTAHGSHGIISSLAAAHIIADMMTGEPRSLARDSIAALEPSRFRRRERKKALSS